MKWVSVEKKHGLVFIGKKIPFYPDEHEVDETLLRPMDKHGKLVWRLYSLAGRKKFPGEFRMFGEAQDFGFKSTEDDPEELTKLTFEALDENLKVSNSKERAYIGLALGVKKHIRATELLFRLLSDRSSKVRAEATCALTQIAGKDYSNTPTKWQRWWKRDRKKIESQENSDLS